ncbi:MAG TPA: amidohydrolase [Gemmatimonadaceae bacterium]|nr:amidohydrolase [Gemmatimonadaceae bacterium]
MRKVLPLALGLSVACSPAAQDPADLLIVGGKVYTSDTAQWNAEAIAVKQGRVVFVGSRRDAMAYRGDSTQVEDVNGATVVAGIVDAHAHVANLGLRGIDLMGTQTYDEIVQMIAERAKTTPKGEWILGRGWDQNDWPEKAFPTHQKLSAAVPDHPVALTRVDGHALLVNATAMRAAKLTASTRSPEGGQIEKANGAPTGVLIDNAMGLVRGVIPAPTGQQMRDAILAAQEQMVRWGLTGVHDAGASALAMDAYQALGREGKLSARYYIMLSDDAALLKEWFARAPAIGEYDGHLWVRMIKSYMDGALGSRGAALLAPYSDDAKNVGLLRTTPEHIQELAGQALQHGYQLGVHAIGDRANQLVLDAFEAALKANPKPDHRFRVEHSQILDPKDIPRFKSLGVIPSMQASHQTSDMYWAGDRLGDTRLKGAYAWHALIESGVIIPNGSDFPVEKVNPLISFHSSISRQDEKNWPAGGWRPEERMTRDQALLSMTLWPAMAAFQESELGTLTVGKRADFVVLDQDIMTIPAEQVLATKVLTTYVGGKAVYRR